MVATVESLSRWWLSLRPWARRLIGGAIVIAVVGLIYLAASSRTGTGLPPSTPGTAAADAVLNEILFLPSRGESEFIELKALADDSGFDGWTVSNEKQQTYALPSTTPHLDAGEVLLVIFDGGNAVEGHTVHADRRVFLNHQKGSVQLSDATGLIVDRVAWGRGQPGGVNLGRGGALEELVDGTSVGRFPLSVKAQDFFEWLTFADEQVTPGAANPNPRVEVLLPIDGAFFSQPSIDLGWYPVAGAVRYRVQIATDSQFGRMIEDRVSDAPSFTTSALPPGEYFWRVHAVFADDSVAVASPASSFTISATELPTEAPQAARSFFSSAYAADTVPPLREGVLAVPMIYQHKDTAMLLMETMTESGPHVWDVAHPGLDPTDPADNMNCALASIQMVNHFARGSISQDRLGYELRNGDRPEDAVRPELWPGSV